MDSLKFFLASHLAKNAITPKETSPGRVLWVRRSRNSLQCGVSGRPAVGPLLYDHTALAFLAPWLLQDNPSQARGKGVENFLTELTNSVAGVGKSRCKGPAGAPSKVPWPQRKRTKCLAGPFNPTSCPRQCDWATESTARARRGPSGSYQVSIPASSPRPPPPLPFPT